MWKVRVFTLYPEMFPGPLASGLYKKALEKKIWSLEVVNIRDYATDKHKTVDDTPFGGGSGMVMKADVLANSLDKNSIKNKEPVIYLSPKGKKFDQIYAKKTLDKNINIICGHFEGVDQRILETRNIEEVSIGDLILSGGEIGAFVIIDTVIRLLPGVLGNPDSLSEETFEKNLLEYPQYTKPQKWEGKEIPSVLLTGDHEKIKDWRLARSEDINKANVEKIVSAKKFPEFFPGDIVKVGVRITEGKRERIQYFEGVCIAKKNRDINSSFTIRKISFGEGVERTFALYSPIIGSIKVIRSGKVRRAKLYYLRDRTGKSARIAEKIKKKIGIDLVETKSEVTKESNIEATTDKKNLIKEIKTETKKESSEEKK